MGQTQRQRVCQLVKPVFFIGFMGAGKTSVTEYLAAEYGLAAIDLDAYLEQREQRVIADIFAQDGEDGFRTLETDVLREVAALSPRLVSCGGGVVSRRAENALIMRNAGFVIYLQVSADEAARRIPHTESRPLFKNLETARRTIAERIPQYEAAAHVCVATEGRTIPEVGACVVDILMERAILQVHTPSCT